MRRYRAAPGMASVPSSAAARVTVRSGVRGAALRAAPAAAVVAGVAIVLRLAYAPWYLNYDARYALLWARDAWRGHLPEYTADFAPTPHPLQTAASSLALPFGDAADDLLVWLVLLCFGALVWLVYRLGAALFSPWAGAVAALAVATRPALQRDALLAYQDVPFAALVVGAVLLEARRRRRGMAVLAVLALAGLLRPEAWALSGLYVLYLWRGGSNPERLRFAALAAVAPLIWVATDWIVTGDPLHSMHGTAALAEAVDRRRELSDVPYWTVQYFGFVLREPLLAGIPLGLAFAWLHRRGPAVLPLAAAAAMTAVFAIGPLFGLPLIGRYIRTPAVLLALFYGLAVAGWLMLEPGRARRVWLALGALALAASLAFLPRHAEMLQGLERRVDLDGAYYADLRDISTAPAVRRAMGSCAPMSIADRKPIPYVRWWTCGDPGSVGTVLDGASPLGRLLMVPRRNPLTERIYRAGFPAARPPRAYALIAENRSWRVFGAPGCGTPA